MSLRKLFLIFLGWRILLFAFLFLAIPLLPLQINFIGGGLSNYLKAPYFWAWANFDGEHYLRIALRGYSSLSYFFFPLYPITIRLFSRFFRDYLISGLFVSHFAFLIGIMGLTKAVRLDFNRDVSRLTNALLLLFPTSFYFASLYSESLFFALVVWSFYFARTKRWVLAGILGAFLTATRIVGVALFPAFLVEGLMQWKEGKSDLKKSIFLSFAVMTGLLTYCAFLIKRTGDPLAFFSSLNEVFGDQRSSTLILLPQVFYRYLFKILRNLDYGYLPGVFTAWLEFTTATLFGGLGIVGLLAGFGKLGKVKMRLSYATYLVIGYLIPTFSGSFSSLPRYVLVLFPGFILMAIYLTKFPKLVQMVVFLIMLLVLSVATGLFVRGYWIS